MELFQSFMGEGETQKLVLYCRKHNIETKTTRLISLDSSFSMLRVYSTCCKILTFDSPHSLHNHTSKTRALSRSSGLESNVVGAVVSSHGNMRWNVAGTAYPLNVCILAATRSEGLPGTSRDIHGLPNSSIHCGILELSSWRSEEISSMCSWDLTVWFLAISGDGWTSLYESWDLSQFNSCSPNELHSVTLN